MFDYWKKLENVTAIAHCWRRRNPRRTVKDHPILIRFYGLTAMGVVEWPASRADKSVHLSWIPACAGMTDCTENQLFVWELRDVLAAVSDQSNYHLTFESFMKDMGVEYTNDFAQKIHPVARSEVQP